MVRTITLNRLRLKLSGIIERIAFASNRYVISHGGKPVCVMMNVDEYESLVETRAVLSDRDIVKRIERAERNFQAGRMIPWEKAIQRLGRA